MYVSLRRSLSLGLFFSISASFSVISIKHGIHTQCVTMYVIRCVGFFFVISFFVFVFFAQCNRWGKKLVRNVRFFFVFFSFFSVRPFRVREKNKKVTVDWTSLILIAFAWMRWTSIKGFSFVRHIQSCSLPNYWFFESFSMETILIFKLFRRRLIVDRIWTIVSIVCGRLAGSVVGNWSLKVLEQVIFLCSMFSPSLHEF